MGSIHIVYPGYQPNPTNHTEYRAFINKKKGLGVRSLSSQVGKKQIALTICKGYFDVVK